MAFEFDKLSQLKCDHCGGAIDPKQVPVDPPVKIGCPHCQEPTIVPGKLGTLLVTEAIGKGAAGTVYKALDTTLQRWVAVKLLHPSEGEEKQIVEATVAEARALAALNHPNVVHVHNIGMRNGQPFIVMELLVGSGKLNVMLKEGWVADEQRGLEMGVDIAQALKASCNAGLLHRDVKPGNILFNDEGVAKLLDFSVVINENPDEKVVIGTPYYISPEAAKAEEVDARSDLYSLGATLFHLMTGRPPFAGETQREMLRARLKERAPDIRSVNSSISERTAAIIAKLIERDPADRYQTHDELVQDLREALAAHALMPSGGVASTDLESHEDNELAAIGSAANGRPAPTATPRERLSEEPPPKNNKVLFGGIAAGIVVVLGVVIAIVAGGGGNDDNLAQKDGTTDSKKSIFERDSTKDKSRPPSNKDQSPSKDSSKDAGKKDSSKTGVGKKNTDPTKDGKNGKDSKTGPTKDTATKDGQKEPPQKTKQDIFDEKLAAWEKQTATLLTKAEKTPTSWQTSPMASVVSKAGATVVVDQTGVAQVSGANPATDVYTISIPMAGVTPQQIKAIQLESLLDLANPAKGAGRSSNGNFIITDFDVAYADASGIRPLQFGKPQSSFDQTGQPAAAALDGKRETGWGVYQREKAPNALIFPVNALGTARPADAQPDVVFDSFESDKSDAAKWTVTGDSFSKGNAKSKELTDAKTLTAGIEGSGYLDSRKGVSGDKKKRLDATGMLRSQPFVIRHGRISFKVAGAGEAVIRLMVDGKPVRSTPARGGKSGIFRQEDWDVRDLLGRYAIIEIDDPKAAYIAVDQIVFTDNMSGLKTSITPMPRLLVTIKQESSNANHTLGRFKVSYTLSDDYFIEPAVSNEVRVALLKPSRTNTDNAYIQDFFKKHVEGPTPYLPPLPKPVIPTPPTPPVAKAVVAPEPPGKEGFAVLLGRFEAGKLKNTNDMNAFFAGKIAPMDVTRTAVPWINLSDSDKTKGVLSKSWLFPKATNGGDFKDNFVARFSGVIHVPEPGPYTIWLKADDAATVRINGQPMGATVQPRPLLFGITFKNKGGYSIIVDYGEFALDAHIELAIAKGTFGKLNDKFHLMGDVKNGGLRVTRDTKIAFPKLAIVTPPPTTNPGGKKTEQSPGSPPKPIKHVVANIDPLGKDKNDYRNFDFDDPDTIVLIPRMANWHYWSKPEPEHPIGTWTAIDYKAGGWAIGQASFAIGRPTFFRTSLADMLGKYGAFYARTPFEVGNHKAIRNLRLLVRGIDPCVVYVNGKEADRTKGLVGSGKDIKMDGVSSLAGVQTFDLSKADINKGTNWIAIECHNRPALSDSNFNVDPILVAEKVRILSPDKRVAKSDGWQPVEIEAYQFNDALVLSRRGGSKPPVLVRQNLSIPITRKKTVYLVARIRVNQIAKGKTIKIVASCEDPGQPANKRKFSIKGESAAPLESDVWHTHVIAVEPDGRRGAIKTLALTFPKEVKRMELEWIGYAASAPAARALSPKRNTPKQFWNFVK